MTAREKVLNVEFQICAMLAGEQVEFNCPFCELKTTEGEGVLCCNAAAEIVTAMMDHLEHLERCEVVEQIMEKFSESNEMQSRIILN